MRTSTTFASVLAALCIAIAGCGGPATSGGPASGGPQSSAANVGGATGGPVASGGDLCNILGPGDFAAAGIAGAGAVDANNTPPTDYYCVYAGKSSGTGGIEFDAFDVDAATAADVFDTVLNSAGILVRTDRAGDVGADQAVIATNVPGDQGAGTVAIIVVRKGGFVFDIGFPAGPNAEQQLIGLAKLVLSRATAQAG